LFLERFIQLAGRSSRPGFIAIVIPDGALANARLQYAREWMARNVTINGIISLPRQTFRDTGTTAKTSLLLMTAGQSSVNHKVFVATADDLDGCLNRIVGDWRKFWSRLKAKKIGNDISVVKQSSREFISRMDSALLAAEIAKLLDGMRNRFRVNRLSDLIDKKIAIVTGDHVRASRDEAKAYDLDSPYDITKRLVLLRQVTTHRVSRCARKTHTIA